MTARRWVRPRVLVPVGLAVLVLALGLLALHLQYVAQDYGGDPVPYDSAGRLDPRLVRSAERMARDLREKDRADLLELAGVSPSTSAPGVDQLLTAYGGQDVRYAGYDSSPLAIMLAVHCDAATSREISVGLDVERHVYFELFATETWSLGGINIPDDQDPETCPAL